jgi:hypothetical protein
MHAICCPFIWGFQFVGKALLSLLVVCCLTDFACTQTDNPRSTYGVTPHRAELIPPGTVVDREPPKGWSFLVIKSHPKPGSGDISKVNENTNRLASFIFTAFVANAKAEKVGNETQYRLNRVAVGLGTRINGKDVILSPDTQARLGADLRLLARVVLDRTYEMQKEVIIVVNSYTLAVVDTPAIMLRGTQHRDVVIRYILLLDPKKGSLDVLCWLIDKDNQGRYTGASGPIEWLPRNMVQDVNLHVDGNEFGPLGVPTDRAFATARLPKGEQQIPLPDDLKTTAGMQRYTPELAMQMEKRLRELMQANKIP